MMAPDAAQIDADLPMPAGGDTRAGGRIYVCRRADKRVPAGGYTRAGGRIYACRRAEIRMPAGR
jgi:hypothetical protein